MTARLNIELQQCWDTLDEAIDYFLGLVLDLQAAKRFPNPPTDLYIEYGSALLESAELENLSLTLTNL